MQMFHLMQMRMRMQMPFSWNVLKCKCFDYTFANAFELISNVLALYYRFFYLEKKQLMYTNTADCMYISYATLV